MAIGLSRRFAFLAAVYRPAGTSCPSAQDGAMPCLIGASRKRNRPCAALLSGLGHDSMTNAQDWQAQVGQNWARMYRQTDRSFTGLTQRLLERLEPLPGREVFDIGCGAGELSLALARARHGARVTGADISAELVAVAQERAGGRVGVAFEQADAAQWTPPHAPDLLVSRHGVMFFADPVAAFAHLHEIAAPGANLLFSCFRSPAENTWASAIPALLPAAPPPPPGYAPGPFAFADADFVRRRAGRRRVEADRLRGGGLCLYRGVRGRTR